MPKPALLAIDDEPEVLRSIERDLRRQYGAQYRIVRADSGTTALDAAHKLKERDDVVALFLADQRMPFMSGVEFLREAGKIFPSAKKVLLTAYADTTAAIAAINEVRLDYYLLKPWDPPEQLLYPVLDDLLGDWRAHYRPAFDGVRAIGYRWSPYSHVLKDFLGRNSFPYEWIDIAGRETDPEIRKLLDTELCDTLQFPVVIFPDGTKLERPDISVLAERLGLQTRADTSFYDLVIVGAGPAGLAAGVYGASEGLKTVLIEAEAPGGQAGMSSKIENYLGFPAGLSGGDLARRAIMQARRLGVEVISPQRAVQVRVEDPYRIVKLENGSEITCNALLIATGLSWRMLEIPGMDRLHGKGVYYGAALTEAMSCQDEAVFVVGGANSAGQAAMHFSQYANKVTMLIRSNSIAKGMSKYLIDQIEATPNIEVLTSTEMVAVQGEERLDSIVLLDSGTGVRTTVPTSSVFIFIGASPETKWLEGVVAMDERGFLLAGPYVPRTEDRTSREPSLFETSVPGIFVAGDVRHGSIKRVASSVGEGSVCVQMIHEYLAHLSALTPQAAVAGVR